MQSNKIEVDEYGEKALELLFDSSTSFFLTGNGGTGKTFLINHFVTENAKAPDGKRKEVQMLATTGAAAQLYEYGETYHSFFRVFGEKLGNVNAQQKAVMAHFDTYIIDEASMISASQLDLIDRRLRQVTGKEELFGGKQVILVGHLFQASPVVTDENKNEYEAAYGRRYDDVYASIFFFDAECFDPEKFRIIELKKTHRTADPKLQTYLKNLMLGENLSAVCAYFNARSVDPETADYSEAIYVANTNSKVDKYNAAQLAKLESQGVKMIDSRARVWNWDVDLYGRIAKEPAPVDLRFCVGARIIFNRNEADYKNGSMGIVTGMGQVTDHLNDDTYEVVYVQLDGGKLISVRQATWNKYETFIIGQDDDGNDVVNRQIIASFTQYPFQPGWGITAHKSQGKTFPKIIVDVGMISYKEDGQWKKEAVKHILYVALSRATSYEGIQVLQRIRPEFVLVDQKVKEMSSQLLPK